MIEGFEGAESRDTMDLKEALPDRKNLLEKIKLPDIKEMPEKIENASSMPDSIESVSGEMPENLEKYNSDIFNTNNTTEYSANYNLNERGIDGNLKEKEDSACDIHKNCPIENGIYEGERGESKWRPDPEYVPLKKNPESRLWKEILADYNIDGIVFAVGDPDFSVISKGDVEIDEFSDDRSDNFDNADIELARVKGCNPEDVEKWRKDNNYTWHECRDMRTMQKVPSIVHNNISHRGGISEIKAGGYQNG